MRVLLYNQLKPDSIPHFTKLQTQLANRNFNSAQVKKVGKNLFRARLDRRNRLLFSFAECGGEGYILVLECIRNHAYEKSRFLRRGASIEEAKLPDFKQEDESEAVQLTYVNPARREVQALDKFISLDSNQEEVYVLPPPFIVVGSAGSGKTVLVLEKMKEMNGEVLYITRSPHLAENSRSLFYGMNYENEDQEVAFLPFQEFLETIRVPTTREMGAREFGLWFDRHRTSSKLKDAHQVFEEFNGVVTGSSPEKGYLTLEDYLDLGVRESIFGQQERERVYALFMKYLAHLKDASAHDLNLLSHGYQELVRKQWDFVVVDEVQDFTNLQLDLVLRSLKNEGNFILCGDANQIVHPNFFSWTGLRRYFYDPTDRQANRALPRVLHTNYRNSSQVTEFANRILRLKHARFGSVDRESNYLVTSESKKPGAVVLLENRPQLVAEVDEKTHRSTHFAVIVMHNEQKSAAKERFRTPLVFSIQEAKGLEYENVILYDFASEDQARFREITRDITHEDVTKQELKFARARDKTDKSLEIYKFYINSLYVAVTRALANIYMLETNPQQRLFELLGVEAVAASLDFNAEQSSLADWQREAKLLDKQGKTEQADEIRKRILDVQAPKEAPLAMAELRALTAQVIERREKKPMLRLFEYVLLGNDKARLSELRTLGFRPAERLDQSFKTLTQKYYMPYSTKRVDGVRRLVERHGIDHRDRFNFTPLMLAARFCNLKLASMLIDMGAERELVNNAGLNAFQVFVQGMGSLSAHTASRDAEMLSLLKPDKLDLMIDERLVRLDNHKVEFLFCQVMMAAHYTTLAHNFTFTRTEGFDAKGLHTLLAPIFKLMLGREITSSYVSGVLSRNEVNRDYQHNRRIFERRSRGVYMLNPRMRVRIDKEWLPIYELLDRDALFSLMVLDREQVANQELIRILRSHHSYRMSDLREWIDGIPTIEEDMVAKAEKPAIVQQHEPEPQPSPRQARLFEDPR